MKNIFRAIKFWTRILVLMLAIFMLADTVANLVTMETIMTILYVAGGFSFIYIFKK